MIVGLTGEISSVVVGRAISDGKALTEGDLAAIVQVAAIHARPLAKKLEELDHALWEENEEHENEQREPVPMPIPGDGA